MSYAVIQKGMVLICPPKQPNQDGVGCEISFRSDSPLTKGDLGLTIRKPVNKKLLDAVGFAATQQTESMDPNKTEAHLQFGNPLYSLPNGQIDGTHYFCAPEGDVGLRTWVCYLTVWESITNKL